MWERIRYVFRRFMSDASVAKAYANAGTSFGAAFSCLCMGECIGFSQLHAEWARWEKEYAARGFRTYSVDKLESCGGYGEPFPVPVKRGRDERVVLHAEIYRERFLGKIRPSVDVGTLVGRGEVQVRVFEVPSTDD